MSKRSPAQVKDALLEYISLDIKKLQILQCDISQVTDAITSNHTQAQSLCEHFDYVFLHGLYNYQNGYWPCVAYFTHKDIISTINELKHVKTDIGRGRSWLNMTLNEQVMESYLRMFIENQSVVREFYEPEAFVRDIERLSLLQTLVSGLDFITFELYTDKSYLNFGATPISSLLESSLNLDINPSFHGSATTIKDASSKQYLYEFRPITVTSSQSTPFSSLPKLAMSDMNSQQHDDSGIVVTSDVDSTYSHTFQPFSSSPDENPVKNDQQKVETTVSGQRSFIDRYMQLNLQEKEQVEEEFIVSRQRKTKGKRKKKRKENKLSNEIVVADKTTPLTTPTSDAITPTSDASTPFSDLITPISDVAIPSVAMATIDEKVINEESTDFVTELSVNNDQVELNVDVTPTFNTTSIVDKIVVEEAIELSYDQSHDLQQHNQCLSDIIMSSEDASHDSHMTSETRQTDSCLTEQYSSSDSETYQSPPTRSNQITERDKTQCDLLIEQSTQVILSLEVFNNPDEKLIRLVQIQIPVTHGNYQTAYLAITDEGVYLIERDGTEGTYSRMLGMAYNEVEHIVIGLSWQSLCLVYRENELIHKQIVITGNEPVSRSIADCIRMTAASSKEFGKSVPLNRDDETRIEAIERELIKLGSETSMELVRYCLVHWEQLSGDTPLFSPPANIEVPFSGNLSIKESSIWKGPTWKTAYFSLIDGTLYHFNNENDKAPKAVHQMRGTRSGCIRAKEEGKDYAFTVWDSNRSTLLLAAEDEEQMSKWMQLLCMAAIGTETRPNKSPVYINGTYCAVLLTQNKVHVLQEDWSNESVQLITSLSVQDISNIGIDKHVPLYCTLSYESDDGSQGVWMICFSSEYELAQFETKFIEKYKDIFQIEPSFSKITDKAVQTRSKQALELMRASHLRNDSLTTGRTEFTYDF